MDLSLTHVLLMLGTVVVAPLALGVLGVVDRPVIRIAPLAGVLAAIGLALPQGAGAASLALPWALLAVGTAVAAVPSVFRAVRPTVTPTHTGRALAPLAALGFWVVGTCWLLLDRLALDPVGVGPDLVLLTAVHFHFAGLAATTIVTASPGPDRRGIGGMLGTAALVGTMIAPVLVAVGFVAVPALQVAGAVIFTIALLAWSIQAPRVGVGATRAAWFLARASVWVSMPLAVWWATGFVTGLPAPSIPVMAATHGVANALGFALPGLMVLSAGGSGVVSAQVVPDDVVGGSGGGRERTSGA